MSDTSTRDRIAAFGRSILDRGLTFGSTGNISVRTDDGWLMTPTGSSLGDLDPARISKLDAQGGHLSGDRPTKESFLISPCTRNGRERARSSTCIPPIRWR